MECLKKQEMHIDKLQELGSGGYGIVFLLSETMALKTYKINSNKIKEEYHRILALGEALTPPFASYRKTVWYPFLFGIIKKR